MHFATVLECSYEYILQKRNLAVQIECNCWYPTNLANILICIQLDGSQGFSGDHQQNAMMLILLAVFIHWSVRLLFGNIVLILLEMKLLLLWNTLIGWWTNGYTMRWDGRHLMEWQKQQSVCKINWKLLVSSNTTARIQFVSMYAFVNPPTASQSEAKFGNSCQRT